MAYEDLVADTPRELEALTAWLSARHRTWRVLRDTPLDAAKRSATNFRGTASATDHFDDLDPAWRAAGFTVLERFGLTGLYGAEPGVAANWRDEWARLGAVTSWN